MPDDIQYPLGDVYFTLPLRYTFFDHIGSKYCMLPGCEAVKVDPDAVLGMLQFFCGPEHIEEAAKIGQSLSETL